MNDLLRTLALNSLFMISDRLMLFLFANGLDKNVVYAGYLLHKIGYIAMLKQVLHQLTRFNPLWQRYLKLKFIIKRLEAGLFCTVFCTDVG